MSPITQTGAAVMLVASLTGCAAMIEQTENMLAAAGFVSRPAETPQQIAEMHSLAPHRFVHQSYKGKQVWLYADPSVCACVYVGNDAAYAAYRREEFAKNLADEQQQAAMMNEDAAMQQSMNWGPWGGMGPWGNFGY